MLMWLHPASTREWGRWSVTKRKTQHRSGGAIWVTVPRHHLSMTLQCTQRHRAPLCPCLWERCVVNTVPCKSGPFSHVKQILAFSPLLSNWVQPLLSAFAQEPASCRNHSAFLTKRRSLSPVPCRPWANCLYMKQAQGDAPGMVQVMMPENTFRYCMEKGSGKR